MVSAAAAGPQHPPSHLFKGSWSLQYSKVNGQFHPSMANSQQAVQCLHAANRPLWWEGGGYIWKTDAPHSITCQHPSTVATVRQCQHAVPARRLRASMGGWRCWSTYSPHVHSILLPCLSIHLTQFIIRLTMFQLQVHTADKHCTEHTAACSCMQ